MSKSHGVGGFNFAQNGASTNLFHFGYYYAPSAGYAPGNVQFTANVWSHFVVTKVDTTIKFYKDNALIVTGNAPTASFTSNGVLPLMIGAWNQAATQPASVIEPSNPPTSTPSTRPSASPSAQSISLPTSQPASIPSSQPSSIPTLQAHLVPTVRPSSEPTVTPTSSSQDLKWTVVVKELDSDAQIAVIDSALWACGGNTNASCVILDTTTGQVQNRLSFPWKETKAILSTGVAGQVIVRGQTQQTLQSSIASCTKVESQQLTCSVNTYDDVEFVAEVFVPYAKKAVFFGSVPPYLSITIIDVTSGFSSVAKMEGFYYTFKSMASVSIDYVQSPPVYAGSYFVGTSVSTNGIHNYIVAGVVRTDAGTMRAFYLAPERRSIQNSAELVNAMELEHTHPDSFMAGGLQLSDNQDMSAYLMCFNVLFGSVKYAARYIASQSVGTESRQLLNAIDATSSVTKGMVRTGSELFLIVQTRNAPDSMSILRIDMLTGTVMQQPNGNGCFWGVSVFNSTVYVTKLCINDIAYHAAILKPTSAPSLRATVADGAAVVSSDGAGGNAENAMLIFGYIVAALVAACFYSQVDSISYESSQSHYSASNSASADSYLSNAFDLSTNHSSEFSYSNNMEISNNSSAKFSLDSNFSIL
eukprot:gene9030-10664_t